MEEEMRKLMEEEEETSSLSYIGQASDDDDDDDDDGGEEEEEVESKRRDCLTSLVELHMFLPIKRGLSDFFEGKSRSFKCLSDLNIAAATAEVLAKPENPYNKRRRLLNSHKRALNSLNKKKYSCKSPSQQAQEAQGVVAEENNGGRPEVTKPLILSDL
ncbi:uncharacterized protein LOC120267174 [Dioscorea cayenensis subsp. rotundata]|uniref:Uncharacterized protein LOC120267174 n=1 Tax=Dioscorea cayennensis subsp. rotundata TaxID=55577 RepID=A0AB40BTN6_DIOCR|nr:uncharacterized protein LOC120267174 [Dioscorea cayenensis subsp. rotundata]